MVAIRKYNKWYDVLYIQMAGKYSDKVPSIQHSTFESKRLFLIPILLLSTNQLCRFCAFTQL